MLTTVKICPRQASLETGHELLSVQPLIAAQLDLYTAMREQGISRADLASRLAVSEKEVSALLSLDYGTPISQVAKALSPVGCELAVGERVA